MSRLKVSIVMAVFNGERYLDQAIRSVLGQSYADVELLVIDGGSRDGTLGIIRSHADRLAYWVSEPDNGMYDAINKGMRKATGDVIAYLNSDDLYYPDTVGVVAGYFDSHPEASVVFGDCEYVDADGKTLYGYRYPGFEWRKFVSLDWMSIPQPTVFWRRNVQEACGMMDPSYRMAGDFEYFSRIGRSFPFSHVGRSLAKFRVHGESLSARGAAANKLEVARLRTAMGISDGPRRNLDRFTREIHIKTLNLPLMVRKALRWTP